MSLRGKTPAILLMLVLGASIAVYGIDKDEAKFQPPAASTFAQKLTISGVTIAAEAYDTEELARKAFGKVHPYQYGVLPVLVVMQNDSKQAIKLDGMQVEYIAASRDRIEATPPKDVPFLRAPKRPNFAGQWPIPLPSKKNPLANAVIQERAFAAKMLPPGDSAYGFFYFRTGHRRGSQLYLTGLREAASNNELFFFEIPLDTH